MDKKELLKSVLALLCRIPKMPDELRREMTDLVLENYDNKDLLLGLKKKLERKIEADSVDFIRAVQANG